MREVHMPTARAAYAAGQQAGHGGEQRGTAAAASHGPGTKPSANVPIAHSAYREMHAVHVNSPVSAVRVRFDDELT